MAIRTIYDQQQPFRANGEATGWVTLVDVSQLCVNTHGFVYDLDNGPEACVIGAINVGASQVRLYQYNGGPVLDCSGFMMTQGATFQCPTQSVDDAGFIETSTLNTIAVEDHGTDSQVVDTLDIDGDLTVSVADGTATIGLALPTPTVDVKDHGGASVAADTIDVTGDLTVSVADGVATLGVTVPSGTIAVEEAGTAKGSVDTLNFASGATVTVAGSEASIAITGGGGATSPLTLTSTAAGQIPLTLIGHASQSVNLLEVKKSDTTVICSISKDGKAFSKTGFSSNKVVIYVDDTAGDDANPGTTGSPKKTLAAALQSSSQYIGESLNIILRGDHMYYWPMLPRARAIDSDGYYEAVPPPIASGLTEESAGFVNIIGESFTDLSSEYTISSLDTASANYLDWIESTDLNPSVRNALTGQFIRITTGLATGAVYNVAQHSVTGRLYIPGHVSVGDRAWDSYEPKPSIGDKFVVCRPSAKVTFSNAYGYTYMTLNSQQLQFANVVIAPDPALSGGFMEIDFFGTGQVYFNLAQFDGSGYSGWSTYCTLYCGGWGYGGFAEYIPALHAKQQNFPFSAISSSEDGWAYVEDSAWFSQSVFNGWGYALAPYYGTNIFIVSAYLYKSNILIHQSSGVSLGTPTTPLVIDDAPSTSGYALYIRNSTVNSLTSVQINNTDAASDALLISEGGRLSVAGTITGTNNGKYGVNITSGRLICGSTPTIAGTTAQAKVGSIVTTWAASLGAGLQLNDPVVDAAVIVTGAVGTANTVGTVADGASAVAAVINSYNAFSNAGAKILSIRNNSVEKFYVGYDGRASGPDITANSGSTSLRLGGSAAASLTADASQAPGAVGAGAYATGVRFYVTAPATLTKVKFYKNASDTTSPRYGRLWDRTGTQLATVTFSGETASGWQEATFSSPYTLDPNVEYVIAVDVAYYSSSAGSWPYSNNGLVVVGGCLGTTASYPGQNDGRNLGGGWPVLSVSGPTDTDHLVSISSGTTEVAYLGGGGSLTTQCIISPSTKGPMRLVSGCTYDSSAITPSAPQFLFEAPTGLTGTSTRLVSVRTGDTEKFFVGLGRFGDPNGINTSGNVIQNNVALAGINFGANQIALNAGIADSGSAVAVIINNNITFTTTGAKLLSIRNATVEKAYVTYAGKGFFYGMDAGSQKITNVQDPGEAQSAATKNYVDNAIAGVGGGLTADQVLGMSVEAFPISAFTYAVSYSSTLVSYRTWTDTATSRLRKRVDYTYNGDNTVNTIRIRTYSSADGTTLTGDTTETFTYSGGQVTGSAMTRAV